ncbi:hypothetical protein [Chondromyces crocatus]|uniref:DUF5050 domain-containing protein n=1 Tax=Chondromyces crocatus TaxID=52 RepID=A0A0K1EGF1_CHOCO|nr:hypothetical protein [Chondromyces crocatus]AKT39951.1 uncharacterized protein CMC5_041040 [Chondromyces crocatus]
MNGITSHLGWLLLGFTFSSAACNALLGDFELEPATEGEPAITDGPTTSTTSAGGQGGASGGNATVAGPGGGDGTGGAAGGPEGGELPCASDCQAGFADCGVCDGVCDTFLLGQDDGNCGECGKTCETGACNAGSCGPVLVADNQLGPVSLASDGTFLYWVNQGSLVDATGSIVKRPIALDGPAQTLIGNQGAPSRLALDRGFLYWTRRNPPSVALMRMGLDGSGILSLSGGTSLVGLALDGEALYWTDQYANKVRRMASPGTQGSSLDFVSSQSGAYGVAVDATHVYWVSQGNRTVMRATKASKIPTMIWTGTTGVDLRSIAVDDKYVYWTTEPDRNASGAPLRGAIMRYHLSSATIEPLGESPAPRDIFVDGERVYWSDSSDFGIFWVHRDENSASQHRIPATGPTLTVTTDATRIYWSTERAIYKMVK